VLGTPWVNTVASGPGGNAYYGDVSVVPNTPDALVQACSVPLFSQLIGQLSPGLPLLDGSRSSCQWLTDADAPAPGIFGPANLPVLERRDWVGNMNDSYWLTNPAQPFARQYARIIGDYQTARSLRTRQGILQVQRRLDGSDGLGAPYRFDLPKLEQVVLSSQVYSGELAQQSVLTTLCGQRSLGPACTALQRWDRRATLDSVGLPLWQEFWNDIAGQPYWKTPFDVNDPVNTPRDFDATLPAVQRGLAQAQWRLLGAGVPLSAPLRQVQISGIDASPIPIFGAEGTIGAFTVADSTDDSSRSQITDGHYPVVFGNSYIQAVTWNAATGVHAEGFLTYSESTDPANPHFDDFTRAYSAQQWAAFPFHPDEIAAAKRSAQVLSGN
jgi:acyl-homoserine-lactone acylase